MKLKLFCRWVFAGLFITASLGVSGQEFSGTLRDVDTGEAIPFANIQIDGDFGAITDEDGRFSFTIPHNITTDSLRFTSLGYATKAVALRDIREEEDIFLARQLVQLEALFIGGEKLGARQVLDSVRKNLKSNYSVDNIRLKVFNRATNAITPHQVDSKIKKARNLLEKGLTKRFNHIIDSISEASIGHTSTNYTSILGEAALHKKWKMQLKKATYLLNQEENIDLNDFTLDVVERLIAGINSENTYHVRSGLFNIGDSLDLSRRLPDVDSKAPDSIRTSVVKQSFVKLMDQTRFEKTDEEDSFIGGMTNLGSVPDEFIREPNDYQYEIDKITVIDDEYVYKINFWPDHNLFGRKGKFEGTLYVSLEDYGILRLQFGLVDGAYGHKVSLGFFGVRLKENVKSGLLLYQRKDVGYYLPKYVKLSGSSAVRLNRDLVMIENNSKRRDRVKLKVKVLLDFDSTYQNEWLITEENGISPKEYAEFMENKGVEEQRLSTYDSKIWENENTLMPTKAILKFKGGG